MSTTIRRWALGAAGIGLGGMVAVTIGSTGLPAPAVTDDGDSPAPSSATVDRDPHSYSPVMPTSICADPSLACEPGETH